MSSMDSVLFSMLMTAYLVVIAAVLAISLVGYIFHSVGLYAIGKRMGHGNAWLAFIPYARKYYQGEMAGEIGLKNKKIKNPGIWYLVLPLAWGAFYGVLIVILCVLAVMGMFGAAAAGSEGMLGGTLFGLAAGYVLLFVAALVYSAAYMALRVLINRQIYARFTTGNMAVVHAVLSAVIPLYEAFCTFTFRDRPFLSEE